MAILLYLATRTIDQALQRARNEQALAASNRELQAIRTSLEQHNARLRSAVERYVAHLGQVKQGRLAARLPLAPDRAGPDDPLVGLDLALNEMTAGSRLWGWNRLRRRLPRFSRPAYRAWPARAKPSARHRI